MKEYFDAVDTDGSGPTDLYQTPGYCLFLLKFTSFMTCDGPPRTSFSVLWPLTPKLATEPYALFRPQKSARDGHGCVLGRSSRPHKSRSCYRTNFVVLVAEPLRGLRERKVTDGRGRCFRFRSRSHSCTILRALDTSLTEPRRSRTSLAVHQMLP